MAKRKAVAAHAKGAPEDEDGDEQSSDAQGETSTSDDDSEFPSEGSSDGDGSDDDEDGAAFESVDVDFEFFNPQEKDFHGLKALLQTYLDGRQYSCSELVEALSAGAVGTVVKCGEDEDPIGVVGALNLRTCSSLEPLAELQSFLAEHAPDDAARQGLAAAWAAPGTGLIVSERLMNCPPQLAPPLMDVLFGEIEAGRKAKETREELDFKRYIFVGRAYVDPLAAAQRQQQQQKKKQNKKGKKGGEAAADASADLVHATPEGEFLSKHAAWKFTFPVPHRAVGKDDLVPHRLVALIEAAAVPAALAELKAVISV